LGWLLTDWLATRKEADKKITHYTQAPKFFDWPPVPEAPLVSISTAMVSGYLQLRQDMIRRGASFLKWQRPPTSQLPLPKGQRLLATGEVVEEKPQE
jgi:hypothetical protein